MVERGDRHRSANDPTPRVTVVMATYNWAPVLPYSIASVLDQDFADFELLVVGDACTDESAEVVAAIDDRRVHWHDLATNHGHQWAPNNEGLRRARGDVVAYLGHDDIWLPGHLTSLVAAIDAGAGLAHDPLLRVNTGEPLSIWPPPGWSYQPGAWIPPTSLGHRRDLAEAAGWWRSPAESGDRDPESDLWGRMAARADVRLGTHLSAVKLSAATRHHVYRQRPHHEQRYWLELIRAAPDPEAAVRARADEPYRHHSPRVSTWTSVWDRARWSARARWRRRRGRPAVTAVERHQLRRRYKGLDR
jgi:glycosyltransferase involved in cell wall biosynthesis